MKMYLKALKDIFKNYHLYSIPILISEVIFHLKYSGSFNKINQHEFFYTESKIFFDQSNIDFEIQKIISILEENTNEYLDSINLMIDSSEMLSIGI